MKKFIKKVIRFLAFVMIAAVLAGAVLFLAGEKLCYTHAQNLLSRGEYAKAAGVFNALENFEDSARLALYARALNAAETGTYAQACEALDLLGDFRDSRLLSRYYQACLLEAEGAEDLSICLKAAEMFDGMGLYRQAQEHKVARQALAYSRAAQMAQAGLYDHAQKIFAQLGSYSDSMSYATYCKAAMDSDAGIYADAIAGFDALHTYRDAPQKKEAVQQAAYEQAEKLLAGCLYSEAYELFAMLGSYSDAEQRILASYYDRASEKLEAKAYEEAYELFTLAGDYQNAGEQILLSKFARGKDHLSHRELDEAEALFLELGTYQAADQMLLLVEEERKRIVYEQAEALLLEEHYEEAYEIFASLGDFSDAAQRISRSYYDRAKVCLQAKDYNEAKMLFALAGNYADAQRQIEIVDLVRLQEAYNQAVALLEENRYDAAYATLETLGDFGGADQMILKSKYNRAEEYLKAQDFDGAEALFAQLGSYGDSAQRVAQVQQARSQAALDKAVEALESGDYSTAYATLEALGDFGGADQMILSSKYMRAQNHIRAKEYEAAEKLLRETAGYEASEQLLAEVGLLHLRKQADEALEKKAYEQAASLYQQLGEQDLVNESNYLLADSQTTKEPWKAYAGFMALSSYKDSLQKAAALYQKRFEYVAPADKNGLRIYSDAGLFGLLDAKADVLVPAQYDQLSLNSLGTYTVSSGGQYGLLGKNGTAFSPVQYDSVACKWNGYLVCRQGLYGILKSDGSALIEPAYDHIEKMKDGRFSVTSRDGKGILLENGTVLIEPDYDSIQQIEKSYYLVTRNKKYGLISYDGKQLHKTELDSIVDGSNDGKYLKITQNQLVGFMEASTGRVVVEPEWADATIMYNGYAYIRNKLNKWGVIDATGKVVVTPKWSDIRYYEDCGHAINEGKFLLNNMGKQVCDFSKYYSVAYLGNGLFRDNYKGALLYDCAKAVAYSYTYDNIYDVEKLTKVGDNLVSGYMRTKSYKYFYGVIDTKNKTLLTTSIWEKEITSLPCRNSVNGKYGWIGSNGIELCKPVYDYIRSSKADGCIIAANYNDRGNLVYEVLDGEKGKVLKKGLASENEALNYAKSLIPSDAAGAAMLVEKDISADQAAQTTDVVRIGSAQGFAGPVTVKVTLNNNKIKGIEIDDAYFAETPGFGAKALEDAFQAQFVGKTLPLDQHDIDALAGATITTTAVIDAINSVMD